MSQEETISLPTVLDYLNEDCWREVLQYVPLKDIILSERVSKLWQRAVLVYLQNIRIHVYEPNTDDGISRDASPLPLREADWWSFREWIKKPGPVVVGACCFTTENFKIIGENCPYLEDLMLNKVLSGPGGILENSGYECFNRLRRVCFKSCQIPEQCIGQLVASPNLEELEIEFDVCQRIMWSGKFLINIKSNNLKSFALKYTSGFCHEDPYFSCFLGAADRFSVLTKLVIDTDEEDFAENLHLLVDKMPKLEHLEVSSNTQFCENFFKSVVKLRNLKYLDVDYFVGDEDLEALARSCPHLRVLNLGYCTDVTREGLQALCSLRLEEVAVQGRRYEIFMTDDEVVEFIRSCPSLKLLKVNGAYELTVDLLTRAAAARRALGAVGPLRLNLDGTQIEEKQKTLNLEQYEELIIEFS